MIKRGAGRLWRALGSLNLAVTLIGLLALAAIAGGTLPQLSRLSPEELNAWQTDWPTLASLVDVVGLSRVYSTWWFSGLCLLLVVNLLAGMIFHLMRVRGWLAGAARPSHRLAGEGPAPDAVSRRVPADAKPQVRGAIGLFGTPLFHFGIIVIVLAAMASASDRFAAHLELSEGELYTGQLEKLIRDGGLRKPDALDFQLRVDRLEVEINQGKNLKELLGHLTVQEPGAEPRAEVLAVNHPVKVGSYTLYLDKKFGHGALFQRILPDGTVRGLVVNFRETYGDWAAGTVPPKKELVTLNNQPMLFDMELSMGDAPQFRLHATRRGQPVFDGTLQPGQMADLGPYRLVFVGTLPWVGLYLASDAAVTWVFVGILIALAGFVLHMLVHPRRMQVVQDGERWELLGWAMRDDWRFAREWQEREAALGK